MADNSLVTHEAAHLVASAIEHALTGTTPGTTICAIVAGTSGMSLIANTPFNCAVVLAYENERCRLQGTRLRDTCLSEEDTETASQLHFSPTRNAHKAGGWLAHTAIPSTVAGKLTDDVGVMHVAAPALVTAVTPFVTALPTLTDLQAAMFGQPADLPTACAVANYSTEALAQMREALER